MGSSHTIDGSPEWYLHERGGGYGVRCSCGWRSPLFLTSGLAVDAAHYHLARAGIDAPPRRRWRVTRR